MSSRIATAAKMNFEQGSPGEDSPVPHRLLVGEAVTQLGWGTMTYACETCGFEWKVWLTLGVEGPPSLREHDLYVPAPFTLSSCPAWPVNPDATEDERAGLRHMHACTGRMSHVRFREDEEFAPRLIPDDAPRFVLDGWADHGAIVMPTPALIRARRHHAEAGR